MQENRNYFRLNPKVLGDGMNFNNLRPLRFYETIQVLANHPDFLVCIFKSFRRLVRIFNLVFLALCTEHGYVLHISNILSVAIYLIYFATF